MFWKLGNSRNALFRIIRERFGWNLKSTQSPKAEPTHAEYYYKTHSNHDLYKKNNFTSKERPYKKRN